MTDGNDPFAALRELFEYGEADGLQDVPPALGLPLSPFPMPGASGAGLSPEDSTRRTVRQLYSALAGLSGAESDQSVLDGWQQYADAFDVDLSATGSREQVAGAVLNTYRVWFYSLAQLLVETYTLSLVHERLVVDDHRGTSEAQKWLWSLPQHDREQLLVHCTTVDDDLVEEMRRARTQRDELLYDFGSWTDANVDVDGSLDDARRYLRVLTGLDDLVSEGQPFSYFPDGSGGVPTDSDNNGEN